MKLKIGGWFAPIGNDLAFDRHAAKIGAIVLRDKPALSDSVELRRFKAGYSSGGGDW
jgi:hypothetical protein